MSRHSRFRRDYLHPVTLSAPSRLQRCVSSSETSKRENSGRGRDSSAASGQAFPTGNGGKDTTRRVCSEGKTTPLRARSFARVAGLGAVEAPRPIESEQTLSSTWLALTPRRPPLLRTGLLCPYLLQRTFRTIELVLLGKACRQELILHCTQKTAHHQITSTQWCVVFCSL